MGTALLVTGDTAEFPADGFPGATIAPMSAAVTGTGKASAGGKPVCIAGDEASVIVAACQYTTPTFKLPGVASLTIQALVPAQSSKVVGSVQKPAILVTARFIARMQVATPASVVISGVAQTDPVATYTGQGEFKSKSKKASAGK